MELVYRRRLNCTDTSRTFDAVLPDSHLGGVFHFEKDATGKWSYGKSEWHKLIGEMTKEDGPVIKAASIKVNQCFAKNPDEELVTVNLSDDDIAAVRRQMEEDE